MKSLSLVFSVLSLFTGCGSQFSQTAAFAAINRTSQPVIAQPTPQPQRALSPIAKAKSVSPGSQDNRSESEPHKPEVAMAPAEPAPATSAAARISGKPLQVKLYRSYGNQETVHIRGRVMEPEPQPPVNADDSTLTNFLRNLDNLSVDEKVGIKVDLTIEGRTVRLVSDAQGMLLVSSELFGQLKPGLHTVTAQLVPGQGYWAPLSENRLVIHPEQADSLGYVTDIDDTIKVSDVVNKLNAVRRLLFLNEKTAQAIAGTAALYQVLEQHDSKQDGDIHYLSGSPLNLAEAIYQFLDINDFPRGAVDLKKWGFQKGDDNPIQQTDYKQAKLRLLLNTYPKRVFICFGDSGEKDPEIYRQISSEFPGRIKAIFINNVTGASASDPRFAGEHLTNNTGEAAEILLREGLISAADVAKVKQAL